MANPVPPGRVRGWVDFIAGIPVPTIFKTSIRVGSGTNSTSDGADGSIIANGATAQIGATARDVPAHTFLWYYTGGKVRLFRGGTDLWLVDETTGLITQDAYTAPTLLNSWVNFGAGFPTAGYRKVKPSGYVEIKGLVKSGVGIGNANPIFTLPAGFAPATERSFAVESNTVFGAVRVATSGNVYVLTGSTAFVYLDGITFDPSV